MNTSALGGDALFEFDDTLTVGQLGQRFSRMLRREFNEEVWVRGEIRNISRPASGHVYFTMVDPAAPGQQPAATIRVVLFDSTKKIVNRTLTRSGTTGFRMDDGVEIRIRAGIEWYSPQGSLQLRMTAIDPEYTIGRLAADREAVLRQLASEGLLEANAALPIPLVPQRIGLVTSSGSAAEADLLEQLASSGYRFDVIPYDARVQGVTAPESIAKAIMLADRQGFDVICVIRGGGSRTDLAAFDHEMVARAIAACNTPVFCGIGHEVDRSIADEVAARSLKTPTACAQELIGLVATADWHFYEAAQRLLTTVRRVPAHHQASIDTATTRLVGAVDRAQRTAGRRLDVLADQTQRSVRRRLSTADARLDEAAVLVPQRAESALQRAAQTVDGAAHQTEQRSQRALHRQARDLDALEARVRALDPVHVLRRGWSITTDDHGRVVTSVADVDPQTTLVTRLADGTVTSQVTTTEALPSEPTETTSEP